MDPNSTDYERIEEVKKLYDRLCCIPCVDSQIDPNDVEILFLIKKEYIPELREYTRDDYCFGGLIANVYGINTFYSVMDIVYQRVDNEVFKWIIDYDGKLTDGANPIDTGIFNIEEMFELIDRYYDSRYYLIYSLESMDEYPTPADKIIAMHSDGYDHIINELTERTYTSEMFDIRVLNDMKENYY